MARDTVLAVRLSQVERDKAESIIKAKGFASLAECIRYALDRVYSNEVVRKDWR
jgi:Arc/MetJ-type ribon-helix-helix transcriptional regulator